MLNQKSVFFLQSWEDYRLAWDVTKYPDITDVFADESEVWRPVFFIDNS